MNGLNVVNMNVINMLPLVLDFCSYRRFVLLSIIKGKSWLDCRVNLGVSRGLERLLAWKA